MVIEGKGERRGELIMAGRIGEVEPADARACDLRELSDCSYPKFHK